MINLRNGQFHHADAIQYMLSLPDECINLIVTDPPYRTISGGNAPTPLSGFRSSVLSANDGKLFRFNDIAIRDYMEQFYRLLKPGSHCYVMTNNLNLRELLNVAADVGFGFHNLLAWRKNTCTANRWYMKECEWTCLFYKRPAVRIRDAGSKQIFEADNPRNKRHPTEKPVELMQHYVLNSSDPGDIVLDPFAGSGSTAMACEATGRRWISVECDPVYYYAAVGRVYATV